MNTNDTSETANHGVPTNAPTHLAYQVRDGKDSKGFWTRIGAAWQHRDGKGFNVQLECLPLDGRVTLRAATEKEPQA